MVKKCNYSVKEDNFIKNNYLKMTNKQLAKKLNRSSGAIAARLTKLKLRRIKKKVNLKLFQNGRILYQ
ncbi:hypothetical protein NSA27_02355 [Clostridium tepidum]|uniref:hypothetical protein n=1 Tax=Clostridium tepidum TaxID=1962263 RepID=UPI00214A1F45|nr:hypothetical protein [Clostridium tepidum]MCR1933544.1 hypothetical protein [Clostridium tepidum]